jgi:hypothetical protein
MKMFIGGDVTKGASQGMILQPHSKMSSFSPKKLQQPAAMKQCTDMFHEVMIK